MKLRRKKRNIKGQSLVEYVIIVVVVAIAAIAIVGVFSDRVRSLFGGAASELGANSGDVSSALDTNSADLIKDMDDEGLGN